MKKAAKYIAVAVAIVLILGLLVVANAFVGNPISKLLATNTAKDHLARKYADTDFVLEEVSYSFKTGGYYARVVSPSSADTYFSLSLTGTGKLTRDAYGDMVLSGRNTMERLNREYRKMVETVFDAADFPYPSELSFGDIQELHDIPVESNELDFGLDRATLELDRDYDMRELGKTCGSITFYAQDEDVSPRRAAELLLDITRILDEEAVPFYAINFVLEKPRSPDGTPSADQRGLHLTDFLYADIYEEGLEARVQASADATAAYYAVLDAEKGGETG